MTRETSPAWHVDGASLRTWVAGTAGPLLNASVETHVVACAECRAAVALLVPPAHLKPVWEEVLAEVEVPRAGPAQRLLRRIGLTSSDALIVVSAVSMRAAWTFGLIGVLGFAILAALLGGDGDGSLFLFLVAAPLIPVAGVAAAYGPSSDPSYEAVLAAPYAMLRLILLRTVAVLATSVPFAVVAGLLLPASPSIAVAWLLPAAGFIVVVLTASNWVDPAAAAVVVAVGWATCVVWATRVGDPLLVFAPAAIAAYVVLLTVAGVVLLHRLLAAQPSWRLR